MAHLYMAITTNEDTSPQMTYSSMDLHKLKLFKSMLEAFNATTCTSSATRANFDNFVLCM